MSEEQLISVLIQHGTEWIKQLRAQYRPTGLILSDDARSALNPFFEARILDEARFCEVPVIENPPFYALLPQGMAMPIDFTRMAGLTVGDTVLLAPSRIRQGIPVRPILFHELVHVVQYDILGVDEFIRQYVNGWAVNGKQYERIPMEQEAYALQARFANGGRFSVAAVVAGRLSTTATG